jgi:signal transduction histidine kinase
MRLIEAEKMASLGTMVAGIAHEINTPVGVGVLAASTLQNQTRDLTTSFAERRMTQSDLRGYLEASGAGTALIATSLERIGKLIASFRRVAVNRHIQSPQAQPIAIAECLRTTLASFGERLLKGPFQVQVNCSESLVMQGYSGDLESVFTNLIANSLQHGFKGRTQGCIHITVQQHDNRLHIEYRDNGNGLSAEASKRVFDPFFTTDMQGGMGLGMHLVYNLLTQRMGGSISVGPNIYAGACFLIEVPTQAEPENL